jgi:hypothetical protein
MNAAWLEFHSVRCGVCTYESDSASLVIVYGKDES